MDTKSKNQANISFSFPMVKENDTCPFWESTGDASLIPMQECWYCKFSDFRRNVGEHQAYSVCRCPENRLVERKIERWR